MYRIKKLAICWTIKQRMSISVSHNTTQSGPSYTFTLSQNLFPNIAQLLQCDGFDSAVLIEEVEDFVGAFVCLSLFVKIYL